MVTDAGRSNCHFSKPSHSHLCTGEALGRIEIEPGEKLFIASFDLKDVFYHTALSRFLPVIMLSVAKVLPAAIAAIFFQMPALTSVTAILYYMFLATMAGS